MPIFEYRCRKCEKRFETIVRSEGSVACPSCGGSRLEKLLSTFAVSAGGSQSATHGGGTPGACGSCGDPRGPGSCRFDE